MANIPNKFLPSIIKRCKTYVDNIYSDIYDRDNQPRLFVNLCVVPDAMANKLSAKGFLRPKVFYIGNAKTGKVLAYAILYSFACSREDIYGIPDMSVDASASTIYFTSYDDKQTYFYYAQLVFTEPNIIKPSLEVSSCWFNRSLTKEVTDAYLRVLKREHDLRCDFAYEETDA